MDKFSVRDDILAQHYVTVKLNTFGDKKINTYNGKETVTYWGNCHVDGVEKIWFISENMHGKIKEANFGEGDTFCVLKWKAADKIGYNYLPVDDIQIKNATPMKEQIQQPEMEAYVEQNGDPATLSGAPADFDNVPPPPIPPKDDIQERIIRGMCGNQAATLLSDVILDDRPKEHFELTKALYELESDWYRG